MNVYFLTILVCIKRRNKTVFDTFVSLSIERDTTTDFFDIETIVDKYFQEVKFRLTTITMSNYNDYQHGPSESASDEGELSSPKIEQKRSKPIVPLGCGRKRSATSDRPLVKRRKFTRQETRPIKSPMQLDVKPPVRLGEWDTIVMKQERAQPEPSSIPYIIKREVTSPPLSPPRSLPTIPVIDLTEEESIEYNLDATKSEATPVHTDIVKIKEDEIQYEPLKLTADEKCMADEGQAAAAILLKLMNE